MRPIFRDFVVPLVVLGMGIGVTSYLFKTGPAEAEADIEKGLLNIKSPLARALIGKEEGDSVEVRTPGGEKSYEVLSIQYV